MEAITSLKKRANQAYYIPIVAMIQDTCNAIAMNFAARYTSREVIDHERFIASVKDSEGRLKYNQLIGK